MFCYFVLHLSYAESFLIGAVLSSTGCRQCFLYSQDKKNLIFKNSTAPLLEIESGSNDPVSYLLTMIGIIILNGGKLTNLPYFTFAQIVYGIAIGVIIAGLGIVILTKTSLISDGLDTIFMIALIIFSFGVSTAIDGNAFLTVYLLGIILGNSKIKNKNYDSFF